MAHPHSRLEVVRAVESSGLIAVVREMTGSHLPALADAFAGGGLRAVAVDVTRPDALTLIRELAPRQPRDFAVGASRVTSESGAREAIAAGARFIMSPVFMPGLIELCHSYDVVMIPGVFTPSEIWRATKAGADMVALFPALPSGPCYLKELRTSLPDAKVIPSGNVHADAIPSWIEAGAAAVAVDATSLDAKALATGNGDTVTEHTRRLVGVIRDVRAHRA